MALSEKHRSSIYLRFTQLLGEEEAAALLSQFPARDVDEPVTKEFVRAEIADVRTELAGIRLDIAGLETRMNERFRQQTMWMTGTMLTGIGVVAGLASLLG